jgi:D-amino peptidase
MRVYISADIEGATGLVSWSQCSRPDGKSFDYAFARRMMTHDVNAAIRGARRAGAEVVVVKDSHGNSKNLLVEDLESGARLISGQGHGRALGMMQGVEEGYDAALLIGYHAMAGTPKAVMEHTLTGGIHRLWVNGVETGEMGLSAGTAGRYGVPIAVVTSDLAGCLEAAALIPGVKAATVKEGLGRYSADLKHPDETAELIEQTVWVALQSLESVKPFVFAEPTTIRLEYNRTEMAQNGHRYPGLSFVDGYTVEGTYPTYEEAHRAIWHLLDFEASGVRSHD